MNTFNTVFLSFASPYYIDFTGLLLVSCTSFSPCIYLLCPPSRVWVAPAACTAPLHPAGTPGGKPLDPRCFSWETPGLRALWATLPSVRLNSCLTFRCHKKQQKQRRGVAAALSPLSVCANLLVVCPKSDGGVSPALFWTLQSARTGWILCAVFSCYRKNKVEVRNTAFPSSNSPSLSALWLSLSGCWHHLCSNTTVAAALLSNQLLQEATSFNGLQIKSLTQQQQNESDTK